MMSSSEMKSILDEELASKDFIYRICLTRIGMQHSSTPTNLETNTQCSGSLNSSRVNKVETLKLWPALKFECSWKQSKDLSVQNYPEGCVAS